MPGPSAWVIHNSLRNDLPSKTINYNADTFKVALFASTSNLSGSGGPDTYAGTVDEIANANGYATGGVSVGVGNYTDSAGTEHFDVADAVWDATGTGFSARYALVYEAVSGRCVAHCTLDSTPADVTVPGGWRLTLKISDVFTAT